jgi:hypothetical protein
VPGNIDLVLGNKITLSILSIVDRSIVGEDKIFAGDWIVAKIQHRINAVKGYDMVLGLRKNGFNKEL